MCRAEGEMVPPNLVRPPQPGVPVPVQPAEPPQPPQPTAHHHDHHDHQPPKDGLGRRLLSLSKLNAIWHNYHYPRHHEEYYKHESEREHEGKDANDPRDDGEEDQEDEREQHQDNGYVVSGGKTLPVHRPGPAIHQADEDRENDDHKPGFHVTIRQQAPPKGACDSDIRSSHTKD